MLLKPATSEVEKRELGGLLRSELEEDLFQQEMGYFWMIAVKMRGPIRVVVVLIPDALFLTFGILGFFNIAGIHVGVWSSLAYLAIALVGFVLSFLMWRMPYVAIITLLRAAYLLGTGLISLLIGTEGLLYLPYYSKYLFLSLINVSVLYSLIWLILGLLTILTPLLLAYSAFRYYLTIMAYGQL